MHIDDFDVTKGDLFLDSADRFLIVMNVSLNHYSQLIEIEYFFLDESYGWTVTKQLFNSWIVTKALRKPE